MLATLLGPLAWAAPARALPEPAVPKADGPEQAPPGSSGPVPVVDGPPAGADAGAGGARGGSEAADDRPSPLPEPTPTDLEGTAPAGSGARPGDPAAGPGGADGESAATGAWLQAWRSEIDRLAVDIETGARTRADADRLYAELTATLWPLQARVEEAVRDDAPDLISRHAELTALHALRSRLFGMLSSRLRLRLTGLSPTSRAEAAHEIDYLRLNFEYQRHILDRGLDHLRAGIEEEPLEALGRIVQMLLAVVVFRWWRRWAKKGLPALRQHFYSARPRRRGAVRNARFLWYLDRVRPPLEWLALLWLLSAIVQPAGFEELSAFVRTILKWLFIGVMAVRLLDARAARTARRPGSETSALRLRSLRLAGYWGVLFGLAVDLTDRYAGTGILHTWVVRVGLATALPVALLLLHWWRGTIFERLSERADDSEWARRLATRRAGLGGYTAAALGAVFLLRDGALQALVRTLSGYEFGRRVIAQLVRREIAREGERESSRDEVPIADEIILPLIAARDVVLEDVARFELDLLAISVVEHGGGSHAIIGERGSGKTVFLERLAARLDGTMRIIDCPAGGYAALEEAIAAEFDIAPGDGFAGRFQEALDKSGTRVVGIDDAHRLPRPWLGGQRGLARLVALTDAIENDVSWVYAVDRRAWRYILLAGGERALLHETIELPTWTEEQLASLVDARAAAIGIEPDFERLVLPRQLDTGEIEDVAQRGRLGYARILWELADGNPEVSLYLFAESLRRCPDGSVILRLPQLSSPSSLVDAHLDALLVLRVLVQCDVASPDDVARSLQLPPDRVAEILRFCTQNGWVVEELGGHRVSWRWFRSVTRALVRQNLMTR